MCWWSLTAMPDTTLSVSPGSVKLTHYPRTVVLFVIAFRPRSGLARANRWWQQIGNARTEDSPIRPTAPNHENRF